MPEVDTKLAANLKKAKSSEMKFAFVFKGTTSVLLVEKKVPPKEISEAKKEVGGGTVVQGTVVGEDGKLVFKFAKNPPGTVEAALKKAMKEQAGLTLPFEVAVDSTLEEEGEETQEESLPQTPPMTPPAAPQQQGQQQPPPPQPGQQTKGSKVLFTQSRLAWEAARKKVQQDLNVLQQEMLKSFAGDEQQNDAVAAAKKIADRLGEFNEDLIDILDEALNATEDQQRDALHKEAKELVQEYVSAVGSDPLIQLLDNNPFTPVTIHQTLTTTLKLLSGRL